MRKRTSDSGSHNKIEGLLIGPLFFHGKFKGKRDITFHCARTEAWENFKQSLGSD